jgi:hypothetical protein
MSSGNFVKSPSQAIGNSSQMGMGLNAYQSVSIDSRADTPYDQAFNGLNSVVSGDSVAGWDYAVVFMSDGQPNPSLTKAQLLSLVDGLNQNAMNKQSLLSFSTVYFGDESDTTAIDRLQSMAKEGQGQFVDTNQTTSLNIDEVVTVPGSNCQ